MKLLCAEYKLMDHSSKSKTCHNFYVKLPHEQEGTKELVEKVLELLKDKIEPLVKGYEYVCDHHAASIKNVLIGSDIKQVKFEKKYTFVFSKGEKPCDKADVYTYRMGEDTHDSFELVGDSLRHKEPKSIGKSEPQGLTGIRPMPSSSEPGLDPTTSAFDPRRSDMIGGNLEHDDQDDELMRMKYLKYKNKYTTLKRN